MKHSFAPRRIAPDWLVRLAATRRAVKSLTVGLALACPIAASALTATPEVTEGPYYTLAAANTVLQTSSPYYASWLYTTEGSDNDLTHITSTSTAASGTLFLLSGTLVNTSGTPVSGATIELWQVDTNGIYLYQSSSSGTNNIAGRDRNFQGFGKVVTDANGAWSFRTVRPAIYTGRIRHFHYKVKINGAVVLTSQFVFQEDSASFSSDGVAAPLVTAGTISLATIAPTLGSDSSGDSALVATKQIVVATTSTGTGTGTTTTSASSLAAIYYKQAGVYFQSSPPNYTQGYYAWALYNYYAQMAAGNAQQAAYLYAKNYAIAYYNGYASVGDYASALAWFNYIDAYAEALPHS